MDAEARILPTIAAQSDRDLMIPHIRAAHIQTELADRSVSSVRLVTTLVYSDVLDRRVFFFREHFPTTAMLLAAFALRGV